MKLTALTCAALCVSASLLYSEGSELQEARSRNPTWIERVLGARRDEDAARRAEERMRAEEKERAEEKKTAQAKRVEGDEEQQSKQVDSVQGKKVKRFTKEEREVLEDWQKGNAKKKQKKKSLPPGLQKKLARGGELPPGWKKKLAVGEVLEPELDERAESLPEEILKRLPEGEAGTEILRVGDEIIRVIENTREIVDILNVGLGTDVQID